MAQYMLLLHETPSDFAGLSPDEIQRVIEEYSAWRAKLEKQNKVVASHKLKDEGGRHLSRRGDTIQVTDGPYAEAREIVGGYFVIEASDYDEAVEISKGCPHLVYGGRIELREIDALDG